MNQKALHKLEYDKIIHILTGHAASAGARALCENLIPCGSLPEIEQAQAETADALRRICRKGSLSFGGIRDIRGFVKRLEIRAESETVRPAGPGGGYPGFPGRIL